MCDAEGDGDPPFRLVEAGHHFDGGGVVIVEHGHVVAVNAEDPFLAPVDAAVKRKEVETSAATARAGLKTQ